MTLEGFKGDGSRSLRDRTIGPRDLLRLPLTSLTRDGQGRVQTTVHEGVGADGLNHKVTSTVTYDGTSGLIDSISYLFEGDGKTFTETFTVNRDGNDEVTDAPISLS